MRYSISESLGYFTEIADDAQLFLRLRGIDKSAFIDNWKIMSIFIVDIKLKKKQSIFISISVTKKKSCDVTSLTIHMALKRYITEEVRKWKNWKQSRISPGLIYTRISKQKIQSCKHVKPNNLHFDTNIKASIKFLFNI